MYIYVLYNIYIGYSETLDKNMNIYLNGFYFNLIIEKVLKNVLNKGLRYIFANFFSC